MGFKTTVPMTASNAANGKVSTQVVAILPNILQSTSFPPLVHAPRNTTAPTSQCVVLTGYFKIVATMTATESRNQKILTITTMFYDVQ